MPHVDVSLPHVDVSLSQVDVQGRQREDDVIWCRRYRNVNVRRTLFGVDVLRPPEDDVYFIVSYAEDYKQYPIFIIVAMVIRNPS